MPHRFEANLEVERNITAIKFSMAAFGGGSLIVPVIIMVLVPGTTSSLVTTSAFTIAFAAILAWNRVLGPNEILAVTAAYAAVLVVFVGTSVSAG